MTRITGLSSGLDIDSLVSSTMEAYKTKLDAVEKQKMVWEYKQEAYQGATDDLREFYDKYFSTTSSSCITLSTAWNNTSFTSSNSAAVGVSSTSNAILGNYTISNVTKAEEAKITVKAEDLTSNLININGEDIDISSANGDSSKIASLINTQMSSSGITATYSEIAGGIVIKTTALGEDQSITLTDGTKTISGQGKNGSVTISDGTNTITKENLTSNTVTIDGITLTLKQNTAAGETISITGENNTEKVKENLVNFINDYNTLIESLNTLVNEKYNSDYLPLTDDEKAEMSDSQIELWEKKAKTGLLSGDSDLKRIINSLKSTMSSFIGTNLNKIGIESVSSYGDSKNGTYSINEETLDKALSNNFDDIKTLFLQAATTTTSDSGKTTTTGGGIAVQMKNSLFSECQSTSASLIKKAGLSSNSALSSTIKTRIEKYESQLETLNTWYNKKETALYNKYAAMESSMTILNNTYSTLSAMLSS